MVSCFNRQATSGGGSLILVKNGTKTRERRDIGNLSIERVIELSCIELDRYIIVCVYRPPTGDIKLFSKIMEDALKCTFNSNKNTIVCGDFNVDLLTESRNKKDLLNLFKSFNIFPLFMEPTRITVHSATCLDNVFASCNYIDKKLINCLQSDHSGQVVTFSATTGNENNQILCRPITEHRTKIFCSNLGKTLPLLTLKNKPNELYNALLNVVTLEFEKVFKPRKVPILPKISFCDWATVGIRVSRNHLYALYERKSTFSTENLSTHIKTYSRIFKHVCREAKSKYINKKIKDSENKIKTVWNIINQETGKVKSRENSFSLNINGVVISKPLEVADAFQDYFSTIPSKTTRTLNSSSVLAEHLLKSNVPVCCSEFKFNHINSVTVTKAFKLLNLKKTEDLWGLSVKVISSIIYQIAPHLVSIFNLGVDKGEFPDLMKLSRLVPLFKSGEKEDPSNYRPVSVLPVLSKVFEKIMLNQMLSYFSANHLLHKKQFGFTKGRSTTDAGIALIKHIFEAWEEKQDAIGVFCDLSKAFDCVDHETLLCKLRHYGVKDISLIRSYLQGRIQRVDINGAKSSGSLVEMGVPQGSILGPLLFLIYINDLPFLVENMCNIVLFADDTSLIFKTKRRDYNFDDANASLSQVMNWFTANNLVLNSSKTKCIKFTLPNVRQTDSDLRLDNAQLDIVNETKFLGITVDNRLQWGPHITTLCSKLSSAAFAVRQIRQFSDVDTARLVYFAYFHSIMSYGILLWGGAADIESVFVLQKRAIRAIYRMRCRDSLREKFKVINILTVPGQYIFENIMFARRNSGLLPRLGDGHNFNTRNQNQLAFPKTRLAKVNKSFIGNSVRFFNKIPEQIKNLPLLKFKTCVKQNLAKKGYYKVSQYIEDSNAWEM